MASIRCTMWAHIRDGCSEQCNIYGSPHSLRSHCTITQTIAADKTTGQSVSALGNSRNTSSFSLFLSRHLSVSPMPILAWPCLFLSSHLYSSELGPSEWIWEARWQAKQQKIDIKSPPPPPPPSIFCGPVHREIAAYNYTVVSKSDLEHSSHFLTSTCQLWDFQHPRL